MKISRRLHRKSFVLLMSLLLVFSVFTSAVGAIGVESEQEEIQERIVEGLVTEPIESDPIVDKTDEGLGTEEPKDSEEEEVELDEETVQHEVDSAGEKEPLIETDFTINLNIKGKNSAILNNRLVTVSQKQTALDALKLALDQSSIPYEIERSSFGSYVKAINDEEAGSFGGWDGWMYTVNGEEPDVGADAYDLKQGDELQFYYSRWAAISSVSEIKSGVKDPTVTVNLVGDTFSKEATDPKHWTIQASATGLEIDKITKIAEQKIQISFKGEAKTGMLSIKALKDAVVGNSASDELLIFVITNHETQKLLENMINDTVNYYKTNRRELSSWMEIVALWGAKENILDGSWTLPAWRTADPKLNVNTGDTEHIRYIFGLLAMGKDPSNAWETKRNLYSELASQQKEDGSIGGINKHAWAMLALDTGEKLNHNVGTWNEQNKQKALKYLQDSQNEDGGFALFGTESDTDVTGMVLLALGNYQGESAVDATIERAKGYLKARQLDLDTAGFNSAGKWGSGDNANSLSTSVSGLVALGEDLLSKEWIVGEKTVIDSYKRFQLEDGSFKWKTKDLNRNLAATEQAFIALLDIQIGKSIWERIGEIELPAQAAEIVEVVSGEPFTLDQKWGNNSSIPVLLDFTKLGSEKLPQVTATRGNTILEIPQGTTVTSTWDKKLQVPTNLSTNESGLHEKINSNLVDKEVSSIALRIKVGGNKRIEFNQHVTLTLKDQGDKEAGFIDEKGNFETIKKYGNSDSRDDDVYSYSDGNDLKIKTRHFTEFLAFKVTQIEAEGPGSGSDGGSNPSTKTVTFSVEKRSIGEGDIISSRNVTLQNGDTAFTLLKRVADQEKISIDSSGSGAGLYVKAIDGLKEFQHGPLSGWMYSVNGIFPTSSAGSYVLKDGDELRWQYTKKLGEEIGGGSSGVVPNPEEEKNPDKKPTIMQTSINDTANWISKNRDFSIYDEFNDWDVLALIRSGKQVSKDYYAGLESHVKKNKGDFRLVTDYERIVLATTALGKDARNIAGYDFVEKIYNNDRLTSQGTNGAVFALLALDSNNYDVPSDALWTREKIINWILNQQASNGGFPLATGSESDIDMTAMVLQALASYQGKKELTASSNQANVKVATDKALTWLSQQQLKNGGFKVLGVENSESISQVILALASLGINVDDKRFKKENGDLLSSLQAYVNKDGGIAHEKGGASDYMATQQGLMAFAAYDRFLKGSNRFYDMTDGKEPSVDKEQVKYTDEASIAKWAIDSVKKATDLGFMEGTSNKIQKFEPKRELTRAEFATLIVRYLDLDLSKNALEFKDVTQKDWHYEYVATAKKNGLIEGVSAHSFEPNRPISRQEMAAIIVRMKEFDTNAKLTGLPKDSKEASKWAVPFVNTAYQLGLMTGDQGLFRPHDIVTREMAAVVVVRLYEMEDQ